MRSERTPLRWKVCRVTTLSAALFSARCGADYLGLHLINSVQPRRLRLFRQIVRRLASRGAVTQPVLLTKMDNVHAIARACETTGIRIVQLHYPVKATMCRQLLAALRRLPGAIPRLILVSTPSAAAAHPAKSWVLANPKSVEAVILDSHWRGGTGKRSTLAELSDARARFRHVPVLVAGGVNVGNAIEILHAVDPDGLDVQSSLELGSRGRHKDGVKLLEFAHVLKRAQDIWLSPSPAPRVALAMTAAHYPSAREILRRFARTDIDVVHLDFSDGTVAPDFLSDTVLMAGILRRQAPCVPYEIHLFVDDERRWAGIIASFLAVNRLLSAVYVYIGNAKARAKSYRGAAYHCQQSFGCPIGYAFHAPRFDVSSLRQYLDRLRVGTRVPLSLITHSTAHDPTLVWRQDRKLLEVLGAMNTARVGGRIVSADRDMTPEKLAEIRAPGVNSVVMGRHLIESPRPQRALDAIRALLRGCEQGGNVCRANGDNTLL